MHQCGGTGGAALHDHADTLRRSNVARTAISGNHVVSPDHTKDIRARNGHAIEPAFHGRPSDLASRRELHLTGIGRLFLGEDMLSTSTGHT